MAQNEILYIFLISFLVVAVITLSISWIIARLLCKPKRYYPNKTPESFNFPFEEIEFFSAKVKLRGWFIPSSYSLPSSQIIILNHGWSSNMSRMLYLAKSLHKNGYSVLLFDFRGHGKSDSDGPITLLKFAEDIISAVNYLVKNKFRRESKIGVFGHSMGASAAILAASMDSRINAIVSCSAFDDPQIVSTTVLRCLKIPKLLIKLNFVVISRWLGRPIEIVAPINVIQKIVRPVLLVHGSADKILSPNNLERLYNASNKSNTEKWILEKGDHQSIIRNSEFAEYVCEFFNKTFNSNAIYTERNKIISKSNFEALTPRKKRQIDLSKVC